MKRGVLGNRNPGERGIWVSRPGADIMSTDPSDFLLSISAETGQVLMAGYITSFSNTGRTINGDRIYGATVTHGLGYVPLFVTKLTGNYFDAMDNWPVYARPLSYEATVDDMAIRVNFAIQNFDPGPYPLVVYYAIYRTPVR